jgi:predicted transcriptional regulator
MPMSRFELPLPQELREALARVARENFRSSASYARWAIAEQIRRDTAAAAEEKQS